MNKLMGFCASVLALPFFLTPKLDEGMWTFDSPPKKVLKEKYQFEPSQEWLDHVQKASVRFNSGGSGSFVSPHGLVMTNHHVGADDLQKVSTPEKDYMKNGFYAHTLEEEIKCPDLELNVLLSIENVTDKVAAGVKAEMDDKEANKARKAVIANIEKEESQKTGLRCDVVTLYQGAEYALYRYKKYTDIRIACAPEKQAAFFGGDYDNFCYPRYDLDFTFFRVYENGKPIESPSYLKWSKDGAQENELVFVSGHPGSTGRLDTVAKCEYFRDYGYPERLKIIKRQIAALRAYSAKSPENARQAEEQIFGLENSKKAFQGYWEGLSNPKVFAKKIEQENAIKKVADADTLKAFENIAQARRVQQSFYKAQAYSTLNGALPGIALRIVMLVREVQKPNGERLAQYRDSSLESTKFSLFSNAPIYAEMDEAVLTDTLVAAAENLGNEDTFVKTALQGRNPKEVAKEWIKNTTLADVETRKKLVDGGVKAIEESKDPLIQLASRCEPIIRGYIKKSEDEVQSVDTVAMEKIAKARFKALGRSVAPDATFTLRLSYGAVKSYELGTTMVPFKTTYYGLFERGASFDNKAPFTIPARLLERKSKMELSTPINFVCTTDIIGGNSGSPVINRNAEVVGLIFDGNIQSLGNRFVYDEEVARAVAVHSEGIIQALRQIYDAGALADEIEGQKSSAGGMAR